MPLVPEFQTALARLSTQLADATTAYKDALSVAQKQYAEVIAKGVRAVVQSDDPAAPPHNEDK